MLRDRPNNNNLNRRRASAKPNQEQNYLNDPPTNTGQPTGRLAQQLPRRLQPPLAIGLQRASAQVATSRPQAAKGANRRQQGKLDELQLDTGIEAGERSAKRQAAAAGLAGRERRQAEGVGVRWLSLLAGQAGESERKALPGQARRAGPTRRHLMRVGAFGAIRSQSRLSSVSRSGRDTPRAVGRLQVAGRPSRRRRRLCPRTPSPIRRGAGSRSCRLVRPGTGQG